MLNIQFSQLHVKEITNLVQFDFLKIKNMYSIAQHISNIIIYLKLQTFLNIL